MLDENTLFREVTLAICGDLDIASALGHAFEVLREAFPVDSLSLQVYERDLGALRIVASAPADAPAGGAPPVAMLSPAARTELDGAVDEQVVVVNRVPTDAVARDMDARFGGRSPISLLILRLRLRGQRIGALVFRADGQDRFTPEHARLVRILNEPFALALTNALRYQEVLRLRDHLADDNRDLQRELRRRSGDEVVGADFGMKPVMDLVRKVAPQASPVLLLGETGVGKEVVASAIHAYSARHDGPVVRVNCGAIPETLLDSELFGHERGAFTGATTQKRGRFERAHGGTIFLDEIGELPASAQTRLLRVLQGGEIERVGGAQTVKVDVRVIAATHRDLEAMVHKGAFREDLWFRLSVFPIRIPPLRERMGDLPALAHHFLEAKARELNLGYRPTLAPGAIDDLLAYRWPGNVRELQNVIERALILAQGQPLTFADLGARARVTGARAEASSDGPVKTLDEAAADHIRAVLSRVGGRVEGAGGAAELLGLNASTLRHRMRKLEVAFGRVAERTR